jgi:hypothetical protein
MVAVRPAVVNHQNSSSRRYLLSVIQLMPSGSDAMSHYSESKNGEGHKS